MFPENFNVFLEHFAVDAEFHCAKGTRVFRTRGIYDCAEMDGDLGKNIKVVASQPRLTLPLANVSGVNRGDEVVLSDATTFPEPSRFRVLEIILEGTGWATLPLVKIDTEPPSSTRSKR